MTSHAGKHVRFSDMYEQSSSSDSITPPSSSASSTMTAKRPALTLTTSFGLHGSPVSPLSPPPGYDNNYYPCTPTPITKTLKPPPPTPASPEPSAYSKQQFLSTAQHLSQIAEAPSSNDSLFQREVHVMPLHHLNMASAVVDCPRCGNRGVTRTKKAIGNTQHAWAAGTTALTGVLGFIPYLIDSLKDVQHFCGACGAHLANWHKSGSVDVLIPGGGNGKSVDRFSSGSGERFVIE